MPYDEALAGRVRAILSEEPDMSEIKMFGGIAFMVNDSMFCGLVRDELMVRVGQPNYEAAMAKPGVREMDFTGHGRAMPGMVFVAPSAFATEAALRDWVYAGLEWTRANPTKKKSKKASK